MYSTVVQAHPTIIRHQTPQPKGIGLGSDATKAFALSDEATRLAEQMRKGKYSVPVKIENSGAEENDHLEVPNFIQSKERVLNNKENEREADPQKFFQDKFSRDVNVLLGDLDNKKDKRERIAVRKKKYFFIFLVLKGKRKLNQDILQIKRTIQSELRELLFAKE